MCWGMTANLSHETQQQELGSTFIKIFMNIMTEREKDPTFLDYGQNLEMTLSSAIRSMAFVRANHVHYLDFNADRLTRRRQSLEQIADFASFSGSGLFAKLGSFVGVGSVADVVTHYDLPQIYIPVFAAFGIVGAFAITLGVSWHVSRTDKTWVNDITHSQTEYWREHFKPDMTEELYNLYLAIKALTERFYPDTKEEIEGKDELLRIREASEVKKFISEKILPPDDLNWPPYTTNLEVVQAPAPSQKKDSGKDNANQSSAPEK